MQRFIGTVLFSFLATLPFAGFQDNGSKEEPQKKDAKKFPRGRGRIIDKKHRDARIAWSNKVHGDKLRKLRKATAATYDCRALGQDTKVQDQGPCGNCYEYSGSEVVACAQLTANLVSLSTVPAFQISVQWLLDYHPELGGCDGGDEWQVAQLYMAGGGGPSLADYPGAGQSPGNPQPVAGKLYTITNMGYCDPAQTANGVAAAQLIKNAMVQFGPISVAVAAGSWGDPGSTPITGNDNNVDHAVLLVGWDDTQSGGCWILKNSWNGWGINGTGYAWIAYGACSVGTEAFWCQAQGAAPPVPPPPVPPAPPVPPTPAMPFTLTVAATSGGGVSYTFSQTPPVGVWDLTKQGLLDKAFTPRQLITPMAP